MARGFLSGIAMGAVVAVGGAVAISLIIDPPDPPKPEATALEVPAGSEFNQSRKDDEAELPTTEPVQPQAQAPRVAAPAPDDLASLQDSDTTRPAEMPEAGQPQGDLVTPEAVPGSGLELAREAPVVTQAESGSAPEVPADEAEMSISTDPAQPRPPETGAGESAFADTVEEAGPGPDVQSEAPVEPAVPDADTNGKNAPEVSVSKDNSPTITIPDTTDPVAEPAQEELVIKVDPDPAVPSEEPEEKAQPAAREEAVAADTEDGSETVLEAESPAGEPVADPVAESAGEAEPEERPVTISPPRSTPETEPEGAGTIRIGKPASRLTDRDERRLPGNAGASQGQPTPQESSPKPVDKADMPPVRRFAVEYQAPENKSKMAIVLIDQPGSSVGIEALSTFPYPISFAVDTALDDAQERMAIYRAAGFEVMALVDLPEGAAPGDVEVAMQVLMERVPEAVGMMEAPGGNVQASRDVSAQVTEILRDSGHGLLLYPKGLNTAQKLAAKEGVPSASIFRDFDAKGEKPSVIRRFLNYAVLKADSEGGVVMVGRLQPDTVTALLLWGLEDRAQAVALAPVSALLQVQQE